MFTGVRRGWVWDGRRPVCSRVVRTEPRPSEGEKEPGQDRLEQGQSMPHHCNSRACNGGAGYSQLQPANARLRAQFFSASRLSSDSRSDLLLLAQVDGAVIRLECGFRAAAVDGAGDGAVHLHLEFAVGRIVLLGDGFAAEFEIEVAIDFSVIGAQFYVGLEVH